MFFPPAEKLKFNYFLKKSSYGHTSMLFFSMFALNPHYLVMFYSESSFCYSSKKLYYIHKYIYISIL